MIQLKQQPLIHRQRPCRFYHRWCCVALGWFVFVALPCQFSQAQWIEAQDLKGPFVDSEPYDVLFLNEDGENAILKIKPIPGQVPEPLPKRGQLVFEFFTNSEEQFEVPYSSLSQIKTFNQLLVDEANQWIEEGEYARAFRNLFHVYNHGGNNDPQLVSSLMSCLFLDGKLNFDSGEFELALSIFEDLYEKDPSFRVPGFPDTPLVEIVMSCHNGMINKRFVKEDYVGVRQQLAAVVDKYGETASQLSRQWTDNFVQRSDELMADARNFAAQGQGREAHLAAKQADQMSPDRPQVMELQEKLLLQFPMIVVGVSQESLRADPNRIENWSARREGRLTQRTLIENTGLTDEGGKFELLNGTIFPDDDIGLKYVMEISDSPAGFAIPPLDAFQLSMRLGAFAEETSEEYKVGWAKILDTVEIEDENRVSFTLRTPFVRPEALLKLPFTAPDTGGQPAQNGFYVKTAEDKGIKTFEINSRYPRRPDRQHPVIVEQYFTSASLAADQLIAGNVDVVDRVPLADLDRLKSAESVKVRAYILPTVHMLVPKIRGAADLDPNFRSGLSLAIDRKMLVDDVICGGNPVNGCVPISGPFPIGTEENDQISYGYDLKARPLAFNSQMGMVMVRLALGARPPLRPEPVPSPSLVIAYPQGGPAGNASAAIARMWSDIGVETTTRELDPGESVPSDDRWDFLYLEVTMEEPLVDIHEIIGPNGIAQDVSAPIEQTLRNLSYSQSWQSACADLRRLHRQVAIDLSVLPLWQVKEHFAYRKTVREIGRDLIHLYQNVDRWKIDLTAEEEQQEP